MPYDVTRTAQRILGDSITKAEITEKAAKLSRENLRLSVNEVLTTAAQGLQERCPFLFKKDDIYFRAILIKGGFRIALLDEMII